MYRSVLIQLQGCTSNVYIRNRGTLHCHVRPAPLTFPFPMSAWIFLIQPIISLLPGQDNDHRYSLPCGSDCRHNRTFFPSTGIFQFADSGRIHVHFVRQLILANSTAYIPMCGAIAAVCTCNLNIGIYNYNQSCRPQIPTTVQWPYALSGPQL